MLKGFEEPAYDDMSQDQKNNDYVALSLIWKDLDESILLIIEEATSAKEAWSILVK